MQSNIILDLEKKGLIKPPEWLSSNLVYISIVGSISYGASNTNRISDIDLFGICVPPKSIVFPHSIGKILGFDEIEDFSIYEKHHINENEKEYDVLVRSIISFFKLIKRSNPNIIDSLFCSQDEILYTTKVGDIIRNNRHMFLSKKCFSTFKEYAFSNLTKMQSKKPDEKGKRYELVKKYGYDVKFAMHCVRLLLEVEQILSEGTINLKKNKDQLRSIKKGEIILLGLI